MVIVERDDAPRGAGQPHGRKRLLRVQRGDLYGPLGYLLSCLRRDHPDSVLIAEVVTPAAFAAFDLGVVRECADLWAKLAPDDPRPHVYRGDVAEARNLVN